MNFNQSIPYRLPNINGKVLVDPHVVILGAGASIASCPIDRNGKQVPALSNIHKILDLTSELKKYQFSNEQLSNFETLFSFIYGKKEYLILEQYLENKVQEYFVSLQIPEEITIYDYLLLSLTEKDLIISFNWDPFLLQAYQRNISVGNLPQLSFPHGNVGMGLCYDCKVKGYADTLCPRCFALLSNSKLLFPIGVKDYNSDPAIKSEWAVAKAYLEQAAGITIFGYGAPETDLEAYTLLRSSYTKSNVVDIAPFTIINLRSEKKTQLQKWGAIFDARMLSFVEKFEDSILWNSPRVSLEALFDAILQQQPREHIKPYKKFCTLSELQCFVKTIKELDMAISK